MNFLGNIWFCPIIELGYFLLKLLNSMCLDGFSVQFFEHQCKDNPNLNNVNCQPQQFKIHGMIACSNKMQAFFWRMLQISSNAFHSIGNGSLFIQILCVLLIRPASAFFCYLGQAPISSMMPKVESDFFAQLQYLQAAALSKVSRRCFQSNIMGHL